MSHLFDLGFPGLLLQAKLPDIGFRALELSRLCLNLDLQFQERLFSAVQLPVKSLEFFIGFLKLLKA